MRYIVGLLLFSGCLESDFLTEDDCREEIDSTKNLTSETKVNLWTQKEIVVCWEPDDIIPFYLRDSIRKSVYEGWSQHIDLNFIGWNECNPYQRADLKIKNIGSDLEINGNTYRGYTSILGMPETPREFPVLILFSFDYCKDSIAEERCLRRIFLHEFGHVLGFIHEQTRKDTPRWCIEYLKNEELEYESHEQQLIGPFDMDGILNYCTGLPDKPSCWDIAQAKLYYGK